MLSVPDRATADGTSYLPARSIVAVGAAPAFAAENHRTHTLYVANSADSTVSVVDLTRCSSLDVSGCRQTSPVISLDGPPLGVAVDEVTDTVYVTNPLDGSVGVIDGAICNAANHTGCHQRPATARAGAFDNVVIVDPVTHMVYTANQGSDPGTVAVIDGTTCNGADTAGCDQQPIATPLVGGGPSGLAFSPRTETIYVANTGLTPDGPVPGGNTLSVINGADCTAAHPAGCNPVGTVPAGPAPVAAVVDPDTDTVYVADSHDGTATGGPGTVAIIDGSRCNGQDSSGCAAQTPRLVIVGSDPIGVDFDSGNNSIYVTNANDDTVSVIDAATCTARHMSGCQDRPPTIAVPGVPVLPVVDAQHHTLYTVNQIDNDISVLSDRTCTARTSSGCRHPAPTVGAGSFPASAATDQHYHTVYLADRHGYAAPFSITMINTSACNANNPAGCARPSRSFRAQRVPLGIAINQRTDSVYVATDGPLELINAGTCNATVSRGCSAARVPAGGYALVVDESTDTVYTLDQKRDGSGYVNVVDGRHCRSGDTTGCSSQTPTNTAIVPVGGNPAGLALDPTTRTLYVTDRADHAVSVVDLRHCHAGDTSRCAGQTPPKVAVPDAAGPLAIDVDPATWTAYVSDNGNFSPGAVSMLDTRHCHAGATTGCTSETPATFNTPAGTGSALRVDRATDTVYLANGNDSSVSIIDARTCNARQTSGCSHLGTIQVGSDPRDLTLDPAHQTVFVPNYYDNNASLFPMRRRC